MAKAKKKRTSKAKKRAKTPSARSVKLRPRKRRADPVVEPTSELPKMDILKQEREFVCRKINHFDKLQFRARQRAITLWVVVVGAGLALASPWVVAVAFVVSILFWYLDATSHTARDDLGKRQAAIEDSLCGWRATDPGFRGRNTAAAGSELFPMQDDDGHRERMAGTAEALHAIWVSARKPTMLILYVTLCVISILLALVARGLAGTT